MSDYVLDHIVSYAATFGSFTVASIFALWILRVNKNKPNEKRVRFWTAAFMLVVITYIALKWIAPDPNPCLYDANGNYLSGCEQRFTEP